MMFENKKEVSPFERDVIERLKTVSKNELLQKKAHDFFVETVNEDYSYNFFWMGRPIIQYPQDIQMMQELIWDVKPDVIIETGIAHGGSLILSASILALLELADASLTGQSLDPAKPKRRVIGVDIDIREHNRIAIEEHAMSSRITMFEGSSVDPSIVEKISAEVGDNQKVLVFLDSNHTHDHVLQELKAYAPMVSKGSYCVVFDTLIENMPPEMYPNRSWGPGDNPMTAVNEYLGANSDFEIDSSIDSKLLVSVAPKGYLKKRK
jgi:cephalosporin hydroxylase